MRRVVSNISAGVSLLLCLLMVALWIRSYRVGETMAYDNCISTSMLSSGKGFACVSSRGSVSLGYLRITDSANAGRQTIPLHADYQRSVPTANLVNTMSWSNKEYWSHFGFGYGSHSDAIFWTSYTMTIRELLLPDWLITCSLAVLPGLWAWRWKRRRRAMTVREHQCVSCGYDLRATPERCPECGTTTGAGI